MTDHAHATSLPIAVNPDRLGAGRTDTLSAPERIVYRSVLERLASGEVVRRADLESAARGAGVTLDAALARLEELDLVMCDRATGDVRCAYPFSGTESLHTVKLAGQERAVHAMCAGGCARHPLHAAESGDHHVSRPADRSAGSRRARPPRRRSLGAGRCRGRCRRTRLGRVGVDSVLSHRQLL